MATSRNETAREDRLLGGAIRLRQPAHGYRAGMDALLLASAVEVEPGMHVLEAGCGAGAALCAAAWRLPQVRFSGLERQAEMAALARENVALNGFGERVAILEADLFAGGETFDGVFCNPPFDEAGRARTPHPARAHAYLSEAGVEAWVKALADRLRGGAALTLIHRAERLPELLAALRGRLGGAEVLPVFPRLGAPAKRVLVRARKGSRAALKVWGGIVLHDASGGHSPEAAALWRGGALKWA